MRFRIGLIYISSNNSNFNNTSSRGNYADLATIVVVVLEGIVEIIIQVLVFVVLATRIGNLISSHDNSYANSRSSKRSCDCNRYTSFNNTEIIVFFT